MVTSPVTMVFIFYHFIKFHIIAFIEFIHMRIIEDPRSYALLMAILASFLTPFVASSINVALPSLGSELGMDPFILSLVPTIYLFAVAVLLIPMGRLADIYGRRRIFQFGIILFTVSSVFAGFSISAEMLLFFRIIQGVGVL